LPWILTVEAQAVVLIRLEWFSVDDWIVAAEVGFSSAVQVVICGFFGGARRKAEEKVSQSREKQVGSPEIRFYSASLS
jgi:hypothetical protein